MKRIQIKLGFISRCELFYYKWFTGLKLWEFDLITHGKWYVVKSFFSDLKEVFFPKIEVK